MIAHARIPVRRGACPGLSAPMPTGDGLLTRFMPIGTVALATFKRVCTAAQTYGNGIVEVTARGSIQIRGLSAASARQFADEIATLEIAAQDGVPILCNPLSGIDAEEILDVTPLAFALRRTLAQRSAAATLDAKVSVAIDGGAKLNLARMPTDIRLTAQSLNGETFLRVAVGGDDASALDLGLVAPEDGAEAAWRLLGLIAERGHHARARDIVAADGADIFREALSARPALRWTPAVADAVQARPDRKERCRDAQVIALHRLRDGALACGIGLAFGHADAGALERLADAAATMGACGLRAAPERTLLAIGLTEQGAADFVAIAEQLGFVARADDPRRHVLACAGAPLCASAYLATRAMAPQIAAAAAPYLDGDLTVHISGCAKGCAYPTAAALTVVGATGHCALVANGSARDAPFAALPVDELPAAIERYLHDHKAAQVQARSI
jgi:precorrin-3B synthase